MHPAYIVIVMTIVVALICWGMVAARANAEQARENLEVTRSAYEATLSVLQMNPTDPDIRAKCLSWGRRYYGETMPDTHTIHLQNGIPVGTSDHQNNAASREARINSDIEARIGHLKMPK